MGYTIKFRKVENGDTIYSASTDVLIESSFASDANAIGKLRLPGVSNGRYGSRHPIQNEKGETIGAMIKGVDLLGYTYACIYSDQSGCFFIAHCPFSAVWGSRSGHDSYISIVELTGEFLFRGKGRKFEPTKALALPKGFVDNPRIFKTMNDGRDLLYVSQKGITFLDMYSRSLTSTISFDDLAYSTSDFAISPKVNILAVAFSSSDSKDPLTGDWKYKNFVRLYQLDQGLIIGEQDLPGDEPKSWKLSFGSSGRTLSVESGNLKHVYELQSG